MNKLQQSVIRTRLISRRDQTSCQWKVETDVELETVSATTYSKPLGRELHVFLRKISRDSCKDWMASDVRHMLRSVRF